MDVVDQVVIELRNAAVERAPGVAGAGRRRGVVGQCIEFVQGGAVVHMLRAHHADGVLNEWVATRLEHGEQNVLFLLHVAQ